MTTRVAGKRRVVDKAAGRDAAPRAGRRAQAEEERRQAERTAARSATPLMPARGQSHAVWSSGAASAGSGTGRVTRRNVRTPETATPPALRLALLALLPGEMGARYRRVLAGESGRALSPLGPVDLLLMCTVVSLVSFGLVMVYSASAIYAQAHYKNAEYLAGKQVAFAAAGISLMILLSHVDYRIWRRLSGFGLLLSIVLLALTMTSWGRTVGGASRWITIAGINVQPAETAKVALIAWLASSLSSKADRVKTFLIGFLPHVLAASVISGLCLLQPDFGSAVMIGVITLVMLVAGGVRLRHILPAALVALPVAYGAVVSSPYRKARFDAFRAPFQHLQTGGYQLAKSQLAFGTGGFSGAGLGDSQQKLFFLPEAHTDFIAAVIGEELGLFGVVSLILLFGLVFVRGLRAAVVAADDFGTLLAAGLTMFIGLQVFVNLAVAVGLVPTKGLVLPFISYGGSGMLVNCAAMGLLLSVSRRRLPAREAAAAEWTQRADAGVATGGLT